MQVTSALLRFLSQVNKVEISDEQVSSDDEGWSDEGESWGEHGVEEDEEEDEGGWINPSNLQQKRRDMQGFDDDLVTKEVEVACLTTDYAMQVNIVVIPIVRNKYINVYLC